MNTIAQDCIAPIAVLSVIDQTTCDPTIPPNGAVVAIITNPIQGVPYLYQWYAGKIPSTPIAGATTSTLAGVASGYYTVVINNSMGMCPSSYTAYVNQRMSFPNAGGGVICNGVNSSAEIIFGPSSPEMPYTIQWSNSDSFTPGTIISGETGPFLDNIGPGSYNATITDEASGCQQAIVFTISASGVNKSDQAIPFISDDVFCSGNSGRIEVGQNFFDFEDSYTWYAGKDPSSTPLSETSNILSGLSEGYYTYKMTDTESGCGVMTYTHVNYIPQFPRINFDFTAQTSCNPLTPNGTITASSLDGEPNSNFMFMLTYFPSMGEEIDLGIWDKLEEGTYVINTRSMMSNCESTSSVTIDDRPATPIISEITSNGNTSCTEPNGNITASLEIGPVSDYTFTWMDKDLNLLGTGPVISGLSAGTYKFKVTHIASACESPLDQVNVLDARVIPVVGTIDMTTAACGQADGGLEVTAVTPGKISDYTFSWYKGADQINGATSATISGLTMGDYSVAATDNNTGCTSEVASQSVSCVTAIEKTKDSHLQIFPNPSEGDFHLTFPNPESQKSIVMFSDVSGKVQLSIETEGSELVVSRVTLRAGLYIVQLNQGTKVYYSKIVVN